MALDTKIFFNSTAFDYVTISTAAVAAVNNDVTQSLASYVTQIALFIIGAVGFLGNLIVIVALFYNRTARKKLTNWFIINQSVIDLVASVFLVANTATPTFNRFVRPLSAGSVPDQLLCLIWLTEIPLWSMFMSSEYGIVLLSFERYLAIVHPLVHALKFTKKKAITCIVLTWLIGVGYNTAYLIPTSGIMEDGTCLIIGVGSRRGLMTVGFVTFGLQYVAPVVCVLTCYGIMTVTLRKRSMMTADVTLNDLNASTKWKPWCCGLGRQLNKFFRRVTSFLLIRFRIYDVDNEYSRDENTKEMSENHSDCYVISSSFCREDTATTFSVAATSPKQYMNNLYANGRLRNLSSGPIKSFEDSQQRNSSEKLKVVLEEFAEASTIRLAEIQAPCREIILTEGLITSKNSSIESTTATIENSQEMFPTSITNATPDFLVTIQNETISPGSSLEPSYTKSVGTYTNTICTNLDIFHVDIHNIDTTTTDTFEDTVHTNISPVASGPIRIASDADISNIETISGSSGLNISPSPITTSRSSVSQLCSYSNDRTRSECQFSNGKNRHSVPTVKPQHEKSANRNRQSVNDKRLLANMKTEMKLSNKSNSKIVKMLLTVTVCYVCCWTLNEVIFVLNRLNISTSGVPYLYNVSVFLVCLHCCINPFVYTIQYGDFQNGVKGIVRELRSRFAGAFACKTVE